jgi:hypothetical protein
MFRVASPWKDESWLGVVVHSCNPSYGEVRDQKDHGLRLASGKKIRPYLKNN